MTLEQEMKNEIIKLEKEIEFIDSELKKITDKMEKYLMIRKKKEHDLNILKSNFFETNEKKEFQTTLAKIMKKRKF